MVLYYYSCSDCDGVIIKPTNANLRTRSSARALLPDAQALLTSSQHSQTLEKSSG